MKVTQEEVVDRQAVLNIELEEVDLDPYIERGYQRVVQQTAIPGFRQGKAPRVIVERYVGRETLLQEVLDYMLIDVTNRAISDEELEVAGVPQFDAIELDPVSFKATVALAPEVDLGSYHGIRVDSEKVEVGDEDVEAEIERLRAAQAVWGPVDRPVTMGDMATLDVDAKVEGRSILDQKGQVYVLVEESNRPVPGFAEKLVGMVDGQPREFALALPDDFSDESRAGEEAEFSVTLSEIKERILPELDDEFAKGVRDGYESLAALRKAIETDLKADAENQEERRFTEAAVEALVAGANIELAPILVEHETQHGRENRESMLERMGMRIDDLKRVSGSSDEELEEELRSRAESSLKRGFALAKLAEMEGLEVSEEDVEERLREVLATQAGRQRNRNRRQRKQDEQDARRGVRDSILERRTVDKLAEIASGEGPVVTAEAVTGTEKDSPSGEGPVVTAETVTETEKDSSSGEGPVVAAEAETDTEEDSSSGEGPVVTAESVADTEKDSPSGEGPVVTKESQTDSGSNEPKSGGETNV